MKKSVLCIAGGTGGGHGFIPRDDVAIEQVAQGGKVAQGHCDSGPHHFFNIHAACEQIGGGWSAMSECESGEISMRVNMKSPIANRFRNMVRIKYARLLRLLRHSRLLGHNQLRLR